MSESRASQSPEAVVRVLLGAAGIEVPEDELAGIVAGYPDLRAQLDRMHRLPVPREQVPDVGCLPADLRPSSP